MARQDHQRRLVEEPGWTPRTLPPLLLRAALAAAAVLLGLAAPPELMGVAAGVALLAALGVLLPLAGAGLAGLAFLRADLALAVGLAGAATALALLGPGPWSAGTRLRLRRGRDVLAPARRYAPFALRLALAAPLLGGGLVLMRGPLLAQALGVAWVLGGFAVALGFLAPWAGLYAALALPLAVPLGASPAWAGLALAGFALMFMDDERLALDGRLTRRGGLFPTVRSEVVLGERR
jgi:hypothetical protein